MNMKHEELNDKEIIIARQIGACLSRFHRGEKRAVKSSAIVSGMQQQAHAWGVSLGDANVRRMIQWLRVTGECAFLCSSTGGGYYVAETIDEMRECCDRLRSRITNQIKTERALRRQLADWTNRNQEYINFE